MAPPPLFYFGRYLAAGAGAAVAAGAAADGVGRGEHKALLPTAVHKVHRDRADLLAELLVDQVGEIVNLELDVLVLGFIQNQPQGRAASAARG